MKMLTPAERLIVAADFKPQPPNGWRWVRKNILELAVALRGTGVYLKVHAFDDELIEEIRSRSPALKIFADLKLFDIPETLAFHGVLLRNVRPEILTVACASGIAGMRALKAELPETEILGVTMLTSMSEEECEDMYHPLTIEDLTTSYATAAEKAGLSGVVSSTKEAYFIRDIVGPDMTVNVAGVRPRWGKVSHDDQNPDRIATPQEAIKNGADRVIVGRPIVRAQNPRTAVLGIIDEIASAMEGKEGAASIFD